MPAKSVCSFALFFAALIIVSTTAFADSQPLQIKGRAIGQNSTEACAGSPIETPIDDLIAPLIKKHPALKLSNSSSCDVLVPTFAGRVVSGTTQLLFVNDKLIQVKLELEPMSWGDSVDFFNVMKAVYGKTNRPALDAFKIFYTVTWKQQGQELELSWPDSTKSAIYKIEVVLSDPKAKKDFLKTVDDNRRLLEASERKDRINDTR